MFDTPSIKDTFIMSPVFETPEECETDPFEFKTDELEERSPAEVPFKLLAGNLLCIRVSVMLV